MLEAVAAHLVRIPRDEKAGLVFYRVQCPQPGCDWVTLVTRAAGGVVEADGNVEFEKLVRCAKCGQDIKVSKTPIKETGHVRGCCRAF